MASNSLGVELVYQMDQIGKWCPNSLSYLLDYPQGELVDELRKILVAAQTKDHQPETFAPRIHLSAHVKLKTQLHEEGILVPLGEDHQH